MFAYILILQNVSKNTQINDYVRLNNDERNNLDFKINIEVQEFDGAELFYLKFIYAFLN